MNLRVIGTRRESFGRSSERPSIGKARWMHVRQIPLWGLLTMRQTMRLRLQPR